ncbi:hypothetical protein BU24DRAFT_431467 [Aaosphaeria arxii CBS 175.79]|uniref:Uncharacterized protein n=1 Tax=Aaosphaeria arxii CBS 175.79 TaxID=1450172 RepID=A0A6A5Y4J3_9PLEO|nr:uncharacterized protein BU24DRAFT_431467 [Aaosphaeria arxii CBS 175.79]KAF2019801.1 hypothetical protein BU24DRAFT_431467 [Aaosphaeria arxii CBS 175.79]
MASDSEVIPLLPTTYRNRQHMVRLVKADVQAFLEFELDVTRLNVIHDWLWLVGLPTSPRALHYQRLKKREIVVTEQLDLHLVWRPTRILIKPLPRFLLCPQFWQCSICPDRDLYCVALGFLLSYVALIEREVDFHIARSLDLIPSDLTWAGWLALAEEISHTPVNRRFFYGELRLGRLNWIYRLVLGKPRGYLSGCTTYGAFMRDNVNSLITLFAYTTIVLSAMQVGLSTQLLADNYAFGMASYVFSVFSILAPLSAIMIIVLLMGFIFIINLLRTLRIRGKRIRQGAGV